MVAAVMSIRQGGTPNVSDAVRGIPCSVWHAPWFVRGDTGSGTMPWETYARLSPRAQLYCRYLVRGEQDPEPEWSEPSFGTTTASGGNDDVVVKQTVAKL